MANIDDDEGWDDEKEQLALFNQQISKLQSDFIGKPRPVIRMQAQLSNDVPSKPLGLGRLSVQNLDFTALIELRRSHQTRQAATGVRTRKLGTHSKSSAVTSMRHEVARKLREILKEDSDLGGNAGASRNSRWTGQTTGGNSANAAVVANAVAASVSG